MGFDLDFRDLNPPGSPTEMAIDSYERRGWGGYAVRRRLAMVPHGASV